LKLLALTAFWVWKIRLKTGIIVSKVSGLINLKNSAAKELKDRKAIIPALSHLIRHPKFGYILVDTGLDSLASKTPGGSFKGLIKSIYFKDRHIVENGEGIDEQLKDMNIELKALFLTHAHEHLSGLDSLPKNIIRVCGEGEKDTNFFPLVYSDYFKRYVFQKIDFTEAQDMPIVGRASDVFGDGSFWAISTSGHTQGHISYLVNCVDCPVLLTGDICITEKGYRMGVESGSHSEDLVKTKESFWKIKQFAEKYPYVKVVYGHEDEKFKIKYI